MVGATQVAYKFHYEISINDASNMIETLELPSCILVCVCLFLFFFLKVLSFPNTLYMCNYIHLQLDHSK